jgi:hypothetical protein
VNGHSPYAEVLAHFTSCDRRSRLITEQQLAGLAAHIAGLIADPRENRMRQAG